MDLEQIRSRQDMKVLQLEFKFICYCICINIKKLNFIITQLQKLRSDSSKL